MDSISLADAWKSGDLSKGLREDYNARLNPFYKADTGKPKPFPKGAPLGPAPLPSVRTLIRNRTWPNPEPDGILSPKPDYPAHWGTDWFQSIQGITHDDTSWYVSTESRLWKFPLEFDLGATPSGPGVSSIGIPSDLATAGYNHFGDIDYQDGQVFVPLEGEEAGLSVRLVIFSADDLSQVPVSAELGSAGAIPGERQGTSGPWCAVNPMNGLLYSSDFNASALYLYQLLPDAAVEFVGAIALLDENGDKITVNRVQGGVFTAATGHLYLVSNTATTGILAFDIVSVRRVAACQVDYSPSRSFRVPKTPQTTLDKVVAFVSGAASVVLENVVAGPDAVTVAWDELEGITILDCDDGRSPGVSGQLHIVMNTPDTSKIREVAVDSLLAGRLPKSFPTTMTSKHYACATPEDKTKM